MLTTAFSGHWRQNLARRLARQGLSPLEVGWLYQIVACRAVHWKQKQERMGFLSLHSPAGRMARFVPGSAD
jgi:hypothetical protein